MAGRFDLRGELVMQRGDDRPVRRDRCIFGRDLRLEYAGYDIVLRGKRLRRVARGGWAEQIGGEFPIEIYILYIFIKIIQITIERFAAPDPQSG